MKSDQRLIFSLFKDLGVWIRAGLSSKELMYAGNFQYP